MTSSTEQTDTSLVFADQDHNYYVIPVDIFERGRVPAERKAEVEQLMSEHEVTGYNPALVVAAAAATGAAAGAGIALVGVAVGVGIGVALTSSDCFERKTIPAY